MFFMTRIVEKNFEMDDFGTKCQKFWKILYYTYIYWNQGQGRDG